MNRNVIGAASVAAALFLLSAGCQKVDDETEAPKVEKSGMSSRPVPGGGTAPTGATAPGGGGDSMTKALNNPNTPPEMKEKIRKMQGAGAPR